MAVTTARSSATTDAAPSEPRPRGSSWVIQVTALSLLLGCFLGIALQAQRAIRESGLPATRFSTILPYYKALKDTNQSLQQEVSLLRQKTVQYEAQMAAGSDVKRTLVKNMQDLQMLGGLTPIHGPGVEVILRDYKGPLPEGLGPDAPELGLIHDRDLAMVLNELKAAGAEGLAIAGADGPLHRITLYSAPRCAGPIVLVNGSPVSGPYRILAIGEPAGLENALMIRGGVVDFLQLKTLGMIEIRRKADIRLPAYSGSIKFTHAKPLDEPEPVEAE